jgi:hypothetical protein
MHNHNASLKKKKTFLFKIKFVELTIKKLLNENVFNFSQLGEMLKKIVVGDGGQQIANE